MCLWTNKWQEKSVCSPAHSYCATSDWTKFPTSDSACASDSITMLVKPVKDKLWQKEDRREWGKSVALFSPASSLQSFPEIYISFACNFSKRLYCLEWDVWWGCMILHVNDKTVCVLVHPDGEVSVDSLSPAHTLSSVPSPASIEALSPSSLHVRSFPLPCFLNLNPYFQCKLFSSGFACEHVRMYPLNAVRTKETFFPEGDQMLAAVI